MAFTRPWDESVPTGAEQASDIDLIFRNLKQDLRERLDNVVTDFTSDPIVGPPRVKVQRTTNQTISNATATAISWSAAVHDPNSMWSVSPNPTRLTVPTGVSPSGCWMIFG